MINSCLIHIAKCICFHKFLLFSPVNNIGWYLRQSYVRCVHTCFNHNGNTCVAFWGISIELCGDITLTKWLTCMCLPFCWQILKDAEPFATILNCTNYVSKSPSWYKLLHKMFHFQLGLTAAFENFCTTFRNIAQLSAPCIAKK